MPAASTPNLGEVARRLDDVFNRFEQVANELPKTFVSRELFDANKELVKASDDAIKQQMAAYEKRIADLEDDKKWLYRLIVGAVILALIGVVVSASSLTNRSSGSNAPSSNTHGLQQSRVVSRQ